MNLVYDYIPPFPFPDGGGKRDIDEEISFDGVPDGDVDGTKDGI